MENINQANEVKSRFWQKVVFAFCLITILLSLLSISSSFANALTPKNSSKSNSVMVFNGSYVDHGISLAFPETEGLCLSHNLGVDLGVEKELM
ncbi:MAG: hypothetical protein WC412_09115 [Candidatus Omnitrophota bacterium]|jgi:hypothetical protein